MLKPSFETQTITRFGRHKLLWATSQYFPLKVLMKFLDGFSWN